MKVFTALGMLVVGGVAALVAVSLPELKRYIQIKMM
jgi:hypothetical protein